MIDWTEQWKSFSPNFHDGLAHIDLGGRTLLLEPGPGFGDYSHPTTKITLALLTPLIKDKILLDIGCGSGILSIASVLLGAKKAYGIDIDPEALVHARQNAALNKVTDKTHFATTLQVPAEPCVIAMNMIASEQKIALASLPHLKGIIVTSGVLASQREEYLKFARQNGWVLIKEAEEEGWMGFVFRN